MKGNTCFVNWGDFSRKCEESKSDEFIADLNKKGLTTLASLLQSDKFTFYNDYKNHIHGFSWLLSGDAGVSPAKNLSSLQLLLAAAVEVWQSTRLLCLRNLLRRHVLLHSDPITDRLVPINPEMEKLLYDENGKPRQLPEGNPKLMDYVAKIEKALSESMQYNGINYAVMLYHQLLASINSYIEAALEANTTTSLTRLDSICTAAHIAIKSYKQQIDNITCQTRQEKARQKLLIKEFDKAMTQNAPTIEYIKKSPSYINTRIPTCLS